MSKSDESGEGRSRFHGAQSESLVCFHALEKVFVEMALGVVLTVKALPLPKMRFICEDTAKLP